MKIPEDGKLLRVFIGEADKWQGRPLYEAIVLLAKDLAAQGQIQMQDGREDEMVY